MDSTSISHNQYDRIPIILKCYFNCICAYFIKNKINLLKNQCSLQNRLKWMRKSEWLKYAEIIDFAFLYQC